MQRSSVLATITYVRRLLHGAVRDIAKGDLKSAKHLLSYIDALLSTAEKKLRVGDINV